MDPALVFAVMVEQHSDGTATAVSVTGERIIIRPNTAVFPLKREFDEPVSLSGERINFPMPKAGVQIVCYISHALPGKPVAYCWTFKKLWQIAGNQHAVLYYMHADAEPETLWDEPGVFGLSRYYQTRLWDRGVIWRDRERYAMIVQDNGPAEGNFMDQVPEHDPRVRLSLMSPHYRDTTDPSVSILLR